MVYGNSPTNVARRPVYRQPRHRAERILGAEFLLHAQGAKKWSRGPSLSPVSILELQESPARGCTTSCAKSLRAGETLHRYAGFRIHDPGWQVYMLCKPAMVSVRVFRGPAVPFAWWDAGLIQGRRRSDFVWTPPSVLSGLLLPRLDE